MIRLKRKNFGQLTVRQQRNRLKERKISRLAINLLSQSTNLIVNNSMRTNEAIVNDENVFNPVGQNENIHNKSQSSVESSNVIQEAAEATFTEVCSDSVSEDSSCESMNEETIVRPQDCFREKLADCFIKNNINNVQGNAILAVVRLHSCLTFLPKDSRTLIGTPNRRIELINVEPGKYWHVGFVAGILKELSTKTSAIPNILEIDISTDGVAAEKDGSTQYWPIQFRIVNIPDSSVLIAGVYRGKGKPKDAKAFFKMFTDEVGEVFAKGGLNFKNRLLRVKFRSFIADAPARAFILNHKGHMSSKPCSKCVVVGSRCQNRMVFRGTEHRLRTDIEYEQEDDADHHKTGGSPLTDLGISRVAMVPYDIMHLGHSGVVKKIMAAGVDGKFSRAAKWSVRQINIISLRLQEIAKFCPREFSRKPRPISEYKKYKATEFRQFVLYTGPVVLYGVLDTDFYLNFLLLHLALRIVSTPSASPEDLSFAENALKLFVSSSEQLYGPAFLSYNVHGLLHVVDDVKKFGAVDSFSAYPFENNMPIFRKYVRNQHLPLQQFARRLIERDCYVPSKKVSSSDGPKLFGLHSSGPLPTNCDPNARQFSKLRTSKSFFSIDDNRDNTFMLRDGFLCEVCNILDVRGHHSLAIRKFNTIQNLYTTGKSSSSVGIFKCSELSDHLELVNISEVVAKCYRTPTWSAANTDANMDEFIIMTLLHSQD